MNGQRIAARIYGGGTTTPLLEAIRERTRQAMATESQSFLDERERTITMATTISKSFLDEMEAMEAPESAFVDRWDPEKHPVIIGIVQQIEEVDTNNGTGIRCTLEDQGPDQLSTVSFFLNTVLKNQFEQKRIAAGSVVGIKYFGEVESKSGRSYKNFGVKVQGTEQAQKRQSKIVKPSADADPFEDE